MINFDFGTSESGGGPDPLVPTKVTSMTATVNLKEETREKLARKLVTSQQLQNLLSECNILIGLY
jgi:hypothetical protein